LGGFWFFGGGGGGGGGGGPARGVVVEAELLAAEGGRAAMLAGGVEVMAGGTGCGHGGLSLVVKSKRPSADAGPSVCFHPY